MSGSSDLYAVNQRKPYHSINFVNAHDGFSLADLVSYNMKHNDANGESNRDGSNDNLSWNCGAEGPTSDEEVLALRKRQQRNFMMTLMLALGTPMIVMGGWLSEAFLERRCLMDMVLMHGVTWSAADSVWDIRSMQVL